jgi:hypothetical protein
VFFAAILLVLALVGAACVRTSDLSTGEAPSDPATTSTTQGSGTTTTPAPTAPNEVPGTASDSLDPAVVAGMREEVAALVAEAEAVRGLPFLATPEVTILDEPAFAQRVADAVAEDLDPEEIEIDGRLLELLGMLEPGTDYHQLLIDIYSEQIAGFYEGDTEELVVPASPDGFTPLQRITLLHELVHALTDQHFELNETLEERAETGNGDDAAAFHGLVEGDATRAQFVYMEGLPPADALAAATEALGYDSAVLDSAPAWLRSELLFPYDQGLTFVDQLVSDGGLAGVDQAYQNPPATTEQVLDPAKYLRGEGPAQLDPLTADLAGWDLAYEASFGEWGLRVMFSESLAPGAATQAAAGWGNDTYLVFDSGNGVALASRYVGDAERDAEEVADALIAHARGPMDAGAPVEAGGGLLFDQNGVYVFIDRVDDEVFWIASTDPTAGADLRVQLGL